MFDIGSSELLLIIVVAIVVIGPKDLPRALYKLGQVVGKARGMARHFRTGLDAMVREAELEELQKQWAKDNARIMAETQGTDFGGTMTPLTDQTAPDQSAPAAAANVPDAPASGEPAPAPVHDAAAEAQPALPLDPPPGDDARKGPAAS